jgi:hypothetical protein
VVKVSVMPTEEVLVFDSRFALRARLLKLAEVAPLILGQIIELLFPVEKIQSILAEVLGPLWSDPIEEDRIRYRPLYLRKLFRTRRPTVICLYEGSENGDQICIVVRLRFILFKRLNQGNIVNVCLIPVLLKEKALGRALGLLPMIVELSLPLRCVTASFSGMLKRPLCAGILSVGRLAPSASGRSFPPGLRTSEVLTVKAANSSNLTHARLLRPRMAAHHQVLRVSSKWVGANSSTHKLSASISCSSPNGFM